MNNSKTQRISALLYLGIVLAPSCSNQSNNVSDSTSSSGSDSSSSSGGSSSEQLEEIQTLTGDYSTSETTFSGSGSISGTGTTSEYGTTSEFGTTGTTGIDLPVCGDNILSENEECEAEDFGKLCLNCKLPRYVFVTYAIYQGSFGGIAEADGYCQFAAKDSGLKGTFKAWLTDGNVLNQPLYRFKSEFFNGYYIYPGTSDDPDDLILRQLGKVLNYLISELMLPHMGRLFLMIITFGLILLRMVKKSTKIIVIIG